MRFTSSGAARQGGAKALDRESPAWRLAAQVQAPSRVAAKMWADTRLLASPRRAEMHFCRGNSLSGDAPLGGSAHDLRILASLAHPVLFAFIKRLSGRFEATAHGRSAEKLRSQPPRS